MRKFNVRYTGQFDEQVEAFDQFEAEEEAKRRNQDCWIAEEVFQEEPV